MPSNPFTDGLPALQRLIERARGDTGQCVRCRKFLLAWWNADELGAWNPVDLWSLDDEIAQDVLAVLGLIWASRCYPDSLGFKAQFAALVDLERAGA